MTTRDALAAQEARVAIDSARRRHELAAFRLYREGKPLNAYLEMARARLLTRYGPGELLVVKETANG